MQSSKVVPLDLDFIKELEHHEGEITLAPSPNNKEENQNLEIKLEEYDHCQCNGDEMRSFTESFKNECIEYFRSLENPTAKQEKIEEDDSSTKKSYRDNRTALHDNTVQKNEKEEHKAKLSKSEDKQSKENEKSALNFKESQEDIREANQRRISKEMTEKADKIKQQDRQYFENR